MKCREAWEEGGNQASPESSPGFGLAGTQASDMTSLNLGLPICKTELK